MLFRSFLLRHLNKANRCGQERTRPLGESITGNLPAHRDARATCFVAYPTCPGFFPVCSNISTAVAAAAFSRIFPGEHGGDGRNRTGVHGFAIRCVTTPPRRHLGPLHRQAIWRTGRAIEPAFAEIKRDRFLRHTGIIRRQAAALICCVQHADVAGIRARATMIGLIE